MTSAADADQTPDEARFWDLAEPLLGQPGVTRSTMMGFPCLRVNGQFFASVDRAAGNLVVKLPEERVDALVDQDRALPFAPAGRRFREWAAIPPSKARSWRRLLDDAHEFVATLPPAPPKKRR
ncbi:hypothetical protein B7486_53640 [cyanobacterium TDX16]|nr:hypothetical protein B7486_53640 [cyanobacterium TDX16]